MGSEVSGENADVRVLLVQRAGCHLCGPAAEVVERVCARRGEGFGVVDVDGSAALQEAWGELVPVVLVDGVEVARWRVAEGVLERALAL